MRATNARRNQRYRQPSPQRTTRANRARSRFDGDRETDDVRAAPDYVGEWLRESCARALHQLSRALPPAHYIRKAPRRDIEPSATAPTQKAPARFTRARTMSPSDRSVRKIAWTPASSTVTRLKSSCMP